MQNNSIFLFWNNKKSDSKKKKGEKMMKKKIVKFMMALLIIAVAGAGTSITTQAASAKLNKKKATIAVGKMVTLKVKNAGKKVKWTSSNKKVATVKKSGKYGAVVTGKKAGKVTITAKVGSKKLKCKITVKKKSSSPKYLGDPYNAYHTLAFTFHEVMETGKTYDLANFQYASSLKAADKSNLAKLVKWESSDSSVISVDKYGDAKAKKAGSARITCKAKVNNTGNKKKDWKSKTVTIEVVDPIGVEVTKEFDESILPETWTNPGTFIASISISSAELGTELSRDTLLRYVKAIEEKYGNDSYYLKPMNKVHVKITNNSSSSLTLSNVVTLNPGLDSILMVDCKKRSRDDLTQYVDKGMYPNFRLRTAGQVVVPAKQSATSTFTADDGNLIYFTQSINNGSNTSKISFTFTVGQKQYRYYVDAATCKVIKIVAV